MFVEKAKDILMKEIIKEKLKTTCFIFQYRIISTVRKYARLKRDVICMAVDFILVCIKGFH